MMSFLLYDLKVAVLLGVFYMFYRLLMARETFHRLNRVVLLASLALSALLPLCVITIHRTVEVARQMTVEAGQPIAMLAEDRAWSPISWLSVAYFAGVVFCLSRTLINIYSVHRLMRSCEEVDVPSYVRSKTEKMRLLVSDRDDVRPFSWMNTVVLSRTDYEQDLIDGARGESIVLAHECGHVACRHSIDTLFVDIIAALQWFNPVVWLLREELRTVHEYEADARVLSQGFNAYQYLNLLIHKAAGDAGYSIANGISMSSVLSKRVKMMVKNKSPRYSWAKALYVVPIVAISLAATAKTVVEYKVKESPKEENSAVVNKSEEVVANAGHEKAVVAAVQNDKAAREDDKKLFIIDGNVATEEEVAKLKSGQIESMTVLKGKEATEKWGSRGANGVIIVKTRKAKDAKPTLADSNPVVVSDAVDETQPDDKEKALDVVEEMPKFPGGDVKLMEFLSQNVKYPKDALEKGLQGRVIVGFIVEKDGTISNAKVVSSSRYAEVEIKKDGTVVKKLEKTQESAGSTLEAEALRVVQLMPKWTPGKQKGKPVRVKFNVPIMFRLQ